jgi:hypothetical protein
MSVTRDGLPVAVVPVTGDDFTHTFTADRSVLSGPLGSFWRVDTFDLSSLTTIGNPVFLQDPARRPVAVAAPCATAPNGGRGRLPATGGDRSPLTGVLAAWVGAAGLVLARRRPGGGTRHANSVRVHG